MQPVQVAVAQVAHPGGQGTHSRRFLSAPYPAGQDARQVPINCRVINYSSVVKNVRVIGGKGKGAKVISMSS